MATVGSTFAGAAAGGANIVVTQELFLTPYFCVVEDPACFDIADPLPGPVTDRLGKLADELGIDIDGRDVVDDAPDAQARLFQEVAEEGGLAWMVVRTRGRERRVRRARRACGGRV